MRTVKGVPKQFGRQAKIPPGLADVSLLQGPGAGVLRNEDLAAAEARVGATPTARLTWALDFAQKDLSRLTAGDWANLRLEFSVFAATLITDYNAPVLRRLFQGGVAVEHFRPVFFSEEEVRPAHHEFAKIVSTLIRDKQVRLEFSPSALVVSLPLEAAHGMRTMPHLSSLDFTKDPMGRPRYVLGHLLGMFASVVRECPAPASRGAKEQRCGRWFLAGRPNQDYCSRRCQSRVATRAHRERAAGAKPAARFRGGRGRRAGSRRARSE